MAGIAEMHAFLQFLAYCPTQFLMHHYNDLYKSCERTS
jgi:hypothetical protein